MTGRGVSVLSAFDKVVRLVCPKCGRRGTATWETGAKAGYPAKRQIHDLSAGFVSVEASAKESPRLLCDKCRVPAEERQD